MPHRPGIALVTACEADSLSFALANEMAQQGYDLVLTAGSRESLQPVAAALRQRYAVNVTCIAAELMHSGHLWKLKARLLAQQIEPAVVIICASSQPQRNGLPGIDAPEQQRLQLLTLSELADFYACRMASAGKGYLLLTRDIQPLPAGLGETLHLGLYSLARTLQRRFSGDLNITLLLPRLAHPGQNAQDMPAVVLTARSAIAALLRGQFIASPPTASVGRWWKMQLFPRLTRAVGKRLQPLRAN